ncbi:MAG: hypothetical protein AAGF11_41280 [Myxococcota bacterium]
MRSKALVMMMAASLLTLACGDDSSPPAGESSGGDDTTTAGTPPTPGTTSIGMSSADSTTGAVDSTTGMADGSFLDPSSSSDDAPPEPQPNGSPCMEEAECESGFCYPNPLEGGGICSECVTDEDCDEGTCAIDFTGSGYAICTDGALGLMCTTDEGCMGDLVCTQLINTGGFIPDEFCSECRNDDVPCPDPMQLCAPVYDLANLAGYHGCVEPMSVENGGGCPLDGAVGDGAVCMSGLCGVAMLGGLFPAGVCGECLTDADCMMMGLTTCQPPEADLMAGVTGATCV